jgi:hypothetical protein
LVILFRNLRLQAKVNPTPNRGSGAGAGVGGVLGGFSGGGVQSTGHFGGVGGVGGVGGGGGGGVSGVQQLVFRFAATITAPAKRATTMPEVNNAPPNNLRPLSSLEFVPPTPVTAAEAMLAKSVLLAGVRLLAAPD